MNSKSFFSNLVKDVIRSLRGSLSQNVLNHKLQHEVNIVSRWETGQRKVGFEEFIQLCLCLNYPIEDAFLYFYKFKGSTSRQRIKIMMNLLHGFSSKELAISLGVSVPTVNRWRRGEKFPDLAQVFMLMNQRGHLADFIKYLIPLQNIPRLEEIYLNNGKAKVLFSKHPICSLIMLALETDDYKHRHDHPENYFSTHWGVSSKIEKMLLKKLLDLKLISWQGKKLVSNHCHLNLSPSDQSEKEMINNYQIKKFWDNFGAGKFTYENVKAKHSRMGFKVFVADEKTKTLIEDEFNQFYNRVHDILEKMDHKNAESVYLLKYNFLDLKPLPKDD